jgi:hypothetical protein
VVAAVQRNWRYGPIADLNGSAPRSRRYSTTSVVRHIEVGYRQPPRTTRFTKGRSGNPTGRPRGRHRQAPYEAVLGQMVMIREDGTERRVTAAEAFLLQLAKRGVEGNSAAARASLDVLEDAEKQQKLSGPDRIVRVLVARRRAA